MDRPHIAVDVVDPHLWVGQDGAQWVFGIALLANDKKPFIMSAYDITLTEPK